MQAVQIAAPGGIEALELCEIDAGGPARDGLAVEFLASSINPADIKIRTGAVVPRVGSYPQVLGYDLVGVVVAVGADVRGFRVGDHVVALTTVALTGRGSWAERVYLPASSAAVLPPGVDPLVFARMPLVGMTALQALRQAALKPEDEVLVAGAAGAVGRVLIDLLLHQGHRVLGVVRRQEQLAGMPAAAGFAASVSVPDGGAVDVVLDAAGDDFSAALRDGGRYVSVVPDMLPSRSALASRGIERSVVITQESGADLADLLQLVSAGILSFEVGPTFPLRQIHAAHKEYEHHGQRDVVLVRN